MHVEPTCHLNPCACCHILLIWGDCPWHSWCPCPPMKQLELIIYEALQHRSGLSSAPPPPPPPKETKPRGCWWVDYEEEAIYALTETDCFSRAVSGPFQSCISLITNIPRQPHVTKLREQHPRRKYGGFLHICRMGNCVTVRICMQTLTLSF